MLLEVKDETEKINLFLSGINKLIFKFDAEKDVPEEETTHHLIEFYQSLRKNKPFKTNLHIMKELETRLNSEYQDSIETESFGNMLTRMLRKINPLDNENHSVYLRVRTNNHIYRVTFVKGGLYFKRLDDSKEIDHIDLYHILKQTFEENNLSEDRYKPLYRISANLDKDLYHTTSRLYDHSEDENMVSMETKSDNTDFDQPKQNLTDTEQPPVQQFN